VLGMARRAHGSAEYRSRRQRQIVSERGSLASNSGNNAENFECGRQN